MNDHIAEASKKVGRPQIREIFLRNGARIEPDRDDLPDWIYESAFELLELAAPAVQGEPVAVVDADDDGMWADILPDVTVKVGQTLYTAPQPAEQQPDVAQLVEALSRCRHEASYSIGGEDALGIQLGKVRDIVSETLSALAAYRKGGE